MTCSPSEDAGGILTASGDVNGTPYSVSVTAAGKMVRGGASANLEAEDQKLFRALSQSCVALKINKALPTRPTPTVPVEEPVVPKREEKVKAGGFSTGTITGEPVTALSHRPAARRLTVLCMESPQSRRSARQTRTLEPSAGVPSQAKPKCSPVVPWASCGARSRGPSVVAAAMPLQEEQYVLPGT